jgi:hypothetical protein
VRERHVLRRDVVGLLALLAERQRYVVVGGADLVEIEDLGVPVRGLLEVGAGVGDVIDEGDGEAGGLRGTGAAGIDGGGGGGERLDEAPAADLAVLEVVKLLCDEPLHGGSPAS